MKQTTTTFPETHDRYPNVLHRDDDNGKHRVILCRNGLQYVLQRSRTRQGSVEWSNLSFCVTRAALERCWKIASASSASKTPAPEELSKLPEMAHEMGR